MKTTSAIGLALFLLSTSAAAAATSETLSQVGSTPFGSNASAQVRITYDPWGPSSPYSVQALAGGFELKSSANPLDSFVAWCLDIEHVLKLPATYTVTDEPFNLTTGLISAFRLENLQKLFDTAYGILDLAVSTQSAGFQLALWEILYERDDSLDLNNGKFTANNTGARTFANTLLANLDKEATGSFAMQFYESGENNWGKQLSQNLVSVTPVPLPAAGLLLGAGLIGLFALKRTKREAAADRG